MKQRTFKIAVCVLLFSIHGHAGPLNSSWSACKASNECIVIGPACGEPKAINKKHQEAYEAQQGPIPLECNQPPPSKTQKALCKKSMCTVVDLNSTDH